jgi:hypothetical protein
MAPRQSNWRGTITTGDGRTVKVATYPDGSMKLSFSGGPYMIEAAFLPGPDDGNIHLVPNRPKGVSAEQWMAEFEAGEAEEVAAS